MMMISRYIINNIIDYCIPNWKESYGIDTNRYPVLQHILDVKFSELRLVYNELPQILESIIIPDIAKYIIRPYIKFYTE